MKLNVKYSKIIFAFWVGFQLLMGSHDSIAAIEYKKGTVIVDDEVEEILYGWISQLFKVAGLKDHKPRIYLVVDPEINASATIGGVIIIHTGLIAKCENSEQLLGVLAHEVGHIAGGHVSRMDQAHNEAILPASAAVILGGALAAATGNPSLLMAGLAGGGTLYERTFLKFSRTQESSADTAAIEYLGKLGWGITGLRDFFNVLNSKTAYYASIVSPYALTHPLTAERIKCVEHHLASQADKHPPADIERSFQRLKAKIVGFFDTPKAVLKDLSKYKLSNEGQKYAKAIALYRTGRYQDALSQLDDLLQTAEGNPWYYEMKGEVLFDMGKMGEAIDLLKKAVAKRPQAKYIKIMLAHALMESKQSGGADEAKGLLIPITQKDPENGFAWRLLAQAQGKGNDMGGAALAMAEEALQRGDIPFAMTQTNKALKILPKGSVSHLRAQDLLKELKQIKTS